MKERTRWVLGIGLVALGLVVAITAILVVRFTDEPVEPWGYIGLVVGGLSALGGGILAFIRAKEWSD